LPWLTGASMMIVFSVAVQPGNDAGAHQRREVSICENPATPTDGYPNMKIWLEMSTSE
jgi:hypothetical protein